MTSEREQSKQRINIPPKEQLISDNYTYRVSDTVNEMMSVIDNKTVYPGYPNVGLKMSEDEYNSWVADGLPVERLIGIPNQRPPYFIEKHANRYSPDGTPLSPQVIPYDGTTFYPHLDMAGVQWASDGSQIHPFFHYLVTQSKRGLPTGPGFYWDIGPVYTADAVVLRVHQNKLEVLLVRRKDNDNLALPGGHVDKIYSVSNNHAIVTRETPLKAACREVFEETGVSGLDTVPVVPILPYVPVADPRLTAQAWPVTCVFLFLPNQEHASDMVPVGRSDAKQAAWYLVGGDQQWPGIQANPLFASHSNYLKLAIKEWERQTKCAVRLDSVVGLPELLHK